MNKLQQKRLSQLMHMSESGGLPEVSGFQLGGFKLHQNLNSAVVNVNQEELRMRPKTVMADCLLELSRQQSFEREIEENLQNINTKRVRSASGTSFPQIRTKRNQENQGDKENVQIYASQPNSTKLKNSTLKRRLSRVLSASRKSKQKKPETKIAQKSRCIEKTEDKLPKKGKPRAKLSPPQLKVSHTIQSDQSQKKVENIQRPIWNAPQKDRKSANNQQVKQEINIKGINKEKINDSQVERMNKNSPEEKLQQSQKSIGYVRRCHSYTGVSNKSHQNDFIQAKQLWRNISMQLHGEKQNNQQVTGRRFTQVDIEEQVKKAQERVLMRKRQAAQQHKKELNECFQQKQAEKQFSYAMSDRERRRVNIYAMNNILKMCEEARAKQWLLEHNLGQPTSPNSCLAA